MAHNVNILIQNATIAAETGRKLLLQSTVGFAVAAWQFRAEGNKAPEVKRFKAKITQALLDHGVSQSTAYRQVSIGFQVAEKLMERIGDLVEARHTLDESDFVSAICTHVTTDGVDNTESLKRWIKDGIAYPETASPSEVAAADAADVTDHGMAFDLTGAANVFADVRPAAPAEEISQNGNSDAAPVTLAEWVADMSDADLAEMAKLIRAEVKSRKEAETVADAA